VVNVQGHGKFRHLNKQLQRTERIRIDAQRVKYHLVSIIFPLIKIVWDKWQPQKFKTELTIYGVDISVRPNVGFVTSRCNPPRITNNNITIKLININTVHGRRCRRCSTQWFRWDGSTVAPAAAAAAAEVGMRYPSKIL